MVLHVWQWLLLLLLSFLFARVTLENWWIGLLIIGWVMIAWITTRVSDCLKYWQLYYRELFKFILKRVLPYIDGKHIRRLHEKRKEFWISYTVYTKINLTRPKYTLRPAYSELGFKKSSHSVIYLIVNNSLTSWSGGILLLNFHNFHGYRWYQLNEAGKRSRYQTGSGGTSSRVQPINASFVWSKCNCIHAHVRENRQW